MSKLRHTQQLDTVIRWIGRSIEDANRAGTDVRVEVLETWQKALLTLREDTEAREREIITAEAIIEDNSTVTMERADRQAAVAAVRSVADVVEKLAKLARNGADRQAFNDIDLSAVLILECLHLLARGVVRPNSTVHNKGA